MATITRTILNEGPSKITIHLSLLSDGTQGELVDYNILDPTADFTPQLTRDDQLTLLCAWWGTSWFDVVLKFDALVPEPKWTFPRDCSNYIDFRSFGGLKDASGTDHTGKVLITTNGFEPLGSQGTMIFEFRKN